MKFGKLPSVQHVDFSLPPTPQGNLSVLQKCTNSGQPKKIYIGATGWGMKEWVGTVYPKGSKPTEYLYHYARQFNTIELNSTHYGIPAEATLKKWRDQSNNDFRFCPKVLQKISHSRNLSPAGPLNLVKTFCTAMQLLGEKMGACFLQLPPYFDAERMPALEHFLSQWNEFSLPIGIEVRHESWFSNPSQLERLTSMLEKYRASTVITDVAGRRDVCHMRLTTDFVLIRFVGNGLHPTDYERIDNWVVRLGKWFAEGLREVYFFVHEPDNLLAPELAVYLAKKVATLKDVASRGPKLIPPAPQNQISLF